MSTDELINKLKQHGWSVNKQWNMFFLHNGKTDYRTIHGEKSFQTTAQEILGGLRNDTSFI